MIRSPIHSQHGAALLAMMLIVALGASYYMVSRIESMSVEMKAADRAYNAAVLNRAKRALIGYVAAQAVKAGENNPGAMPCPEAAAYFDDTANEGKVASSCTLPKVGRLPWRTLGLEKLTDAGGEPLWYVVSPGWAYTGGSPPVYTSINSDSKGQLTLDGVAGTDNDTIVALIIAPGPAVVVSTATGCTAWSQVRPTTGSPDWRNYLECDNATNPPDVAFATRGSSASFNDQVITLTKGDVMPAIEAAIADRIEREIVPALKAMYASPAVVVPGGKPVYPYAATFANPGPGSGTSTYQGVAATYRGLLPANQTQNCTAAATNPRCLPNLVAYSPATPANAAEVNGYGYIQTQTCSWATTDIRDCSGEYHESNSEPWRPIRLEMTATFSNVAMGLRAIDATKMTVEARDDTCSPSCAWQAQPVTYTATLNTNGSMTITFGSTMPNIDVMGWGSYALFRLRIDRAVITDHAMMTTTDATLGWFARNEWFRQMYYATVSGYAASTLPATPACTTGTSCLSITNVTPAGAQRAMLILAGRSINGTTRPSATLANYLEFGNATAAFESQTVSRTVAAALKRPFNDRVLVVDSN
jgi:hypothetical protein